MCFLLEYPTRLFTIWWAPKCQIVFPEINASVQCEIKSTFAFVCVICDKGWTWYCSGRFFRILKQFWPVMVVEVVRATVRPSTCGWAPPLVIVLVVVGASSSSSSPQSCADRHAVHISQFCSWRLRACWADGCWGEDGVEEGDIWQEQRKSDISNVKRLVWCQSCGDGKTTSMRRMRGIWRRTDKMYISDLSEDDIEIAIKVWISFLHKTPKRHGWHWK